MAEDKVDVGLNRLFVVLGVLAGLFFVVSGIRFFLAENDPTGLWGLPIGMGSFVAIWLLGALLRWIIRGFRGRD